MYFSELVKRFEKKDWMWELSSGMNRELFSVAMLPETSIEYSSNVLYFSFDADVKNELPPQVIIAGTKEDLEELRDRYRETGSAVAIVRRDRFGEVFNQVREMVEYESQIQTKEDILKVYKSFPEGIEPAIAYCVPTEHPEKFPTLTTFRERLRQKQRFSYVFNTQDGIVVLAELHMLRHKRLLLDIVPEECCVKIGVSKQIMQESRMKSAYYEAREALELGRRIWPEEQVYVFAEVGIFNLLKDAAERQELDRYMSPSLRKLQAYDREMNTNLLETLHTYLLENCSIKDTADRLYIHRNTVIYRLNKIRELTSLNPDSAKTRFLLMLSFAALIVEEKFA